MQTQGKKSAKAKEKNNVSEAKTAVEKIEGKKSTTSQKETHVDKKRRKKKEEQ